MEAFVPIVPNVTAISECSSYVTASLVHLSADFVISA